MQPKIENGLWADPVVHFKGPCEPLDVDVRELFAPAVGAGPLTIPDINQMISVAAGDKGVAFEAGGLQGLDALARAAQFFDIDRSVEPGKFGYRIGKPFTSKPALFENLNHTVYAVSPEKAEQFQEDNPGWTRLPD